MNITYQDGTSETGAQAARRVREEGALYRGFYCDALDHRCLLGVLEGWSYSGGDWLSYGTQLTSESADMLLTAGLNAGANDAFVGTPEQRCEHFAALLDALDK